MRPKSIVLFERFYLGSILINFAMLLLSLGGGISGMSAHVAGTSALSALPSWLLPVLLQILLPLLLWYVTARRASVVGKWATVVHFVIGLAGLVIVLAMGRFQPGLLGGLGAMALALRAVAIWMLFRPDAGPWFGKTPGAEAV